MITLPDNFQTFSKKGESSPATIVKFGDSILEDIQGSAGDWENNSSESQVDYTGGNVTIEAIAVPDVESLTGADALTISSANDVTQFDLRYTMWQSFRQVSGGPKTIDTISLYMGISATTSAWITCAVYDAKNGTLMGYPGAESVTTSTGFVDIDFSGENVVLQNNVIYWIGVSSGINLPYATAPAEDTIDFYYDSTKPYSGGQLDREAFDPPATDANDIGDARFKVSFTGDYYQTTGNITTQIIDLGEIPAVDGEWKFNETEPDQYGVTDVIYTCFGSTDNFSSSNVSIGAKVDGDPIESGDWYRYYKITSTLSTTSQSETPVLHDVGVSFVTYKTFTDRNIFGYEQSLDGISSLSTKIDDFELTTIGQLTCNLGLTETLSNYLYSNYPKNKPAKVLIGFDDPDFAESDFYELYVGAIDKWKITTGNDVNITIKDVSKLWSVDVPKETTTGDGNNTSLTYQSLTFSAVHPIDAMLEILQNHLDIRDAVIDTGSFLAVKASLSGWVITRDFDGPPVETEKADELLNQLRILTSTYFIPDTTGKIRIKEYDSTEAAIETLTDADFLTPLSWESNIDAMINKTLHKYDWNTTTELFTDFYIALDSSSITNNDEVKTWEFEDKWTLVAQVAQVQALKTNILARYAAPPAKITGTLDRKKMYFEVGDMVNLTTTQAPSTDLAGITDTKFQIIEKNFNQNSDKIKFVFLEV